MTTFSGVRRLLPPRLPIEAPPALTAAEQQVEQTIPAPQSLGAVFDQAVDVYKANFVPLLLIVALLLLPVQVLLQAFVAKYLHPGLVQINAQGDEADLVYTLWIYFGYLCTGDPRNSVPGLITLLLPLLLSAPIAAAVGDIYFGRTPSVLNAYRTTLRKLVPITAGITLASLGSVVIVVFWSLIVGIVEFFLVLALSSSFVVLHMESTAGPVMAVVLLLTWTTPYFVLFLFITRYFTFMIPTLMLEESPVMHSTLRTSLLVGKKRYWRTWFALVCLPLFVFGIQGVLTYACNSALSLFHPEPQWQFLSEAFIGAAASCFIQPYWMIFIALLYFDYRVQRECFDLRILTAREARP